MTAPRQVIAGQTYLLTRRCAQRQFLLKPSDQVDENFGYLLGVALERYGVLLHIVVVLSNHYHLVVTDPRGELPAFLQYLDSLLARSLNVAYGRCEDFWAPGSFSGVVLVDVEDIIAKCVYALANPAVAGLVASGREWPGLWSPPEAVGTDWRTFERPERFFSKKGHMPERVTLRLVPPPGMTAGSFKAAVTAALAEREKEASLTREKLGRKVLGVRRILAQKHTDSPATAEPRRKLNPRIAALDKWKRIEALTRLRSFLAEYRVALQKLRDGVKDVVFPHGTYGLRVSLGVACAGAG